MCNDPLEQPHTTNRHFCQTHHHCRAHWFVLPLKWAVSFAPGTAVIASCLNDSNKPLCCSYLRLPSLPSHCHPHLFHYGFSRLDKTAGVHHSMALNQPGRHKEVVKQGNKSHQMEHLLFVRPSYGKVIAASRILNRCNKCWRRGNFLLIGWVWVEGAWVLPFLYLKMGSVKLSNSLSTERTGGAPPFPTFPSKPSQPVCGLTDKHVLCWLIALSVPSRSQVTG